MDRRSFQFDIPVPNANLGDQVVYLDPLHAVFVGALFAFRVHLDFGIGLNRKIANARNDMLDRRRIRSSQI